MLLYLIYYTLFCVCMCIYIFFSSLFFSRVSNVLVLRYVMENMKSTYEKHSFEQAAMEIRSKAEISN